MSVVRGVTFHDQLDVVTLRIPRGSMKLLYVSSEVSVSKVIIAADRGLPNRLSAAASSMYVAHDRRLLLPRRLDGAQPITIPEEDQSGAMYENLG